MFSSTECAAERDGTHHQVQLIHEVEPFLAWCQRAGRNPATPDARSGYAAELLRLSDPAVVAWPPGRNQRCWCGFGRKCEQCCGSAGR